MDTSNLRRIDLNLLTSLHVLLDACNVTRAAERLHLSQPALSAQLRQLREIFADPLLVPAARGMTRTVLADTLIAPLREVLQELERLLAVHRAFDPATAELTVRVLSSDLIHHVISVPLIARLRGVAPGIRIALLPLRPGKQAEQLANGEADVALLVSQALPEQAHRQTLYDERFACVMRPGHPLARGRLSLARFCRYDHVLISTDSGGFHGVVDDVLRTLGQRRHVVTSLPSFLMLPSLLTQSDLLCTVPRRITDGWRDRLAVRTPPCEVPGFTVAMGWHSRSEADPAQRWIRAQIIAVSKDLAGDRVSI